MLIINRYIGTLCAIVTVLALAFDTFPQLVFTTRVASQNLTIPGLLRLEIYDKIEMGALEIGEFVKAWRNLNHKS